MSSAIAVKESLPARLSEPRLSFHPQLPTKQLKPFATEDVKILLLENVNKTGQDILRKQGYQVDFHKTSLPEDQLIEKIRCVAEQLSLSGLLPTELIEMMFFWYETNVVNLNLSLQGRACHRHPVQDKAQRARSRRSQESRRHRLFLHRNEPSRPAVCR